MSSDNNIEKYIDNKIEEISNNILQLDDIVLKDILKKLIDKIPQLLEMEERVALRIITFTLIGAALMIESMNIKSKK